MTDALLATDDTRELERLAADVARLRAALDASADETGRLVAERDALLRRVARQTRELHAAGATGGDRTPQRPGGRSEQELRAAFEQLETLARELESANSSLHETNCALDRRLAQRTHELEANAQALTTSESRFRSLVEGIPQLVWRSLDGGEWTWASPQWTDYTGLSLEDSLGSGWLRALHPDDRPTAEAAWARAEAGETLDMTVRVHHAAENRYHCFGMHAVRGDDAEAAEWVGTSTDIDELRRIQSRQQVLLGELQHRVRGILTIVRSVFGQTVEVGGDLEEVATHFGGRLDSLARTQTIFTQSATGLVDLENLIRDELLSVGASDGPSLSIGGPDTLLPQKAAESIGLAIHELTTNAVKYGALRVSNANLDIAWTIEVDERGQRRLEFVWTEQGVPALALKPLRRGFGSELIHEALPRRLGAETSLEFRAGGVRCAISMPLHDEDAPSRFAIHADVR